MIYKKVITARGVRYFGREDVSARPRLISPKVIPKRALEALERLAPENWFDEAPSAEQPEVLKPNRNCIFCGELGGRAKYVNGQMVTLCDDDYHNHTLGEVVERLRTGSKHEKEVKGQEENADEV